MSLLTPKQQVLAARRGKKNLKLADGYNPEGSHYVAVMEVLNLLEKNAAAQIPVVPNLGPITPGGASILGFDFTHMTTGLGWPAFDTLLTGDPGPSMVVIAPEAITIDTKDSSSSPGEAFYATGASGLRYWFAHLKDDHPLGKKFAKGAKIGDTLPTTVGGGTHLHLAVNLIPVTGRHARYGRDGNGPNYTHGPYTLRRELERPRV
jgi:hypothetical protein